MRIRAFVSLVETRTFARLRGRTLFGRVHLEIPGQPGDLFGIQRAVIEPQLVHLSSDILEGRGATGGTIPPATDDKAGIGTEIDRTAKPGLLAHQLSVDINGTVAV